MAKSGRRLVLVVDGDTTVSNPLVKLLRLRGFEVHVALTAEEGLDALRLLRPSAAIVDLRLPGRSGRDVIVAIPPRVPVIIFSAEPFESSELERLRPRTHLIQKPYSLVMLIDKLQEMLASAEMIPKRGRDK